MDGSQGLIVLGSVQPYSKETVSALKSCSESVFSVDLAKKSVGSVLRCWKGHSKVKLLQLWEELYFCSLRENSC